MTIKIKIANGKIPLPS